MSLLLGWGVYVRDKNASTRLCAKNTGGAYARRGGGGCICGTLRYIITIILTNVQNLLISTVNPCTSNLENKHVDIH